MVLFSTLIHKCFEHSALNFEKFTGPAKLDLNQ